MAGRSLVKVLRLKNYPVLPMLHLEEALLRHTKSSWLIVNDGVPEPTIVMGISAKEEKVVDIPRARKQGLEVIKRFTGGGTVVLDGSSVLVSLICESSVAPGVPLFPNKIMSWSRDFYSPVFSPYGDFDLTETDYTFGDLKFGGNAQYITKQRFLHHTSFLWDYDGGRMRSLLYPPKTPEYRKTRAHEAFVCKLKDFMPDRASFVSSLDRALDEAGLDWVEVDEEHARNQLRASVGTSHVLRTSKVVDIA